MKDTQSARTALARTVFVVFEYALLTALAVVAMQVYKLDMSTSLGLVCTALLAKEGCWNGVSQLNSLKGLLANRAARQVHSRLSR